MGSDDLVLCAIDDSGVATLTLHDPERRNAWSPQMEARYFGLLDELAADTAVRAVVLTADGTIFCPGMAMTLLSNVAGTSGIPGERRSQYTPRSFPKPLIGAVNGACAGIGLVQVLQCDVRFASRTAKFTTSYSRRGIAAEHALTWVLPRLVGLENALDLLLSARVVPAEEAQRLGLVSRVCEPDELLPAAQAYARDLAENCGPTAMATTRLATYANLDVDLTEAARRAYKGMYYFFDHPDLAEGISSFQEKRAPKFIPLDPAFDVRTVMDAAPQVPPGPPAQTG